MKNIFFINSVEKQCGVHSYGLRTFDILKNSKEYNFIYYEPKREFGFDLAVAIKRAEAVIYNYHPLPMAWFTGQRLNGEKHYQVHHEGSHHDGLKPDYYLYVDSMFEETHKIFNLPRPLIEGYKINKIKNKVPVISSFGYGFGSKNYGSIVKMVNDQFDEAIIRLHIPRAYYGDRSGEATAGVLPGIWAEMKNPNIKLEITHDFLTDYELLEFLYGSDLNLFLYDEMNGRGLSSVIDYALSVDVPIAINSSFMFRHVQNEKSNVANHTLQEIIDFGTDHLKIYKQQWSNENLIKKYEQILNDTL